MPTPWWPPALEFFLKDDEDKYISKGAITLDKYARLQRIIDIRQAQVKKSLAADVNYRIQVLREVI